MSDYEYTVIVPKMLLPEYPEPRITISVSKVGGGTLGESYEGLWEYNATCDGKPVMFGADLYTGTAKTHEQAARIVAGFLTEGYVPEDQNDRLSEFAGDE